MANHKFSNSSSIQSCSYDAANKELQITFNSGGTHKYSDVSATVYEGLKMAESPGTYFHKNIRRFFNSSKIES